MNPKPMNILVFGLVATGLTIAMSALVSSYTWSRGPAADARQMAARLEQTTAKLPNWELASSAQIDEDQGKILQCAGSLVQSYTSTKTGDRVVSAVLLGPAGPISLHDPTVCYPMAGFKEVQPQKLETFKVGNKEIKLWTTQMQKGDYSGEKIKIVWGWNDGSGWQAPESNPRVYFAGKPYLIKVQVVLEIQNRPGSDDKGLARFLEEFLPVLDRQLGIGEQPAAEA